MKNLLKLTTVSLAIFSGASFANGMLAPIQGNPTTSKPVQVSSGKSCYPNAGAVIAYVQGYSNNNNFSQPSGQFNNLDKCVNSIIMNEASIVNQPMNLERNGVSTQPMLTVKDLLGNIANWPAQNKLNVAAAINSTCGSPYSQFNSTSTVFKNFLKTYANAAINLPWCSN